MYLFKQKFLFLIILLNLVTSAFTVIPEGIFYKNFLLQDRTTVHVIRVDPAFFDIILAKPTDNKLETVETIAKQHKAIGAINGGFFRAEWNQTGFSVGILKIKDQWHGIPHLPRGAMGWSNSKCKVLFDQLLVSIKDRNCFTVIPKSCPNYTESKEWDSVNYIVGGAPILIRESKVLNDYSSEKTIKSFLYKNHARTAIGILPNGHFLFVVVDGTRNLIFTNKGMTIPNLGSLLQQFGCTEALNLDGGGSSTMYLFGNIVNVPCGDENDEHGNHVRSVSDAILVVPKSI